MKASTALLLGASDAATGVPTWTRAQLIAFKGAFCIPGVFAEDKDRWKGDGKRIWTPAFGAYGDADQDEILRQFVKRYPGGHFVYNTFGRAYGDDYGVMPFDPARNARDLRKIIAAGLIPVTVLIDDAEKVTEGTWRSKLDSVQPIIDACRGLMPIVKLMWEINMCVEPSADEFRDGQWHGVLSPMHIEAKRRMPDSLIAIHFTPKHGSGGNPENQWWLDHGSRDGYPRHGVPFKVIDIKLCQDDNFDDPVGSGEGLESDAVRLHGVLAHYAGCDVATIGYEQQTTCLYHRGRTEAQGIEFTRRMLPHCPSIDGWCDSGPR